MRRIAYLDGWRAVSVSIVVVSHLVPALRPYGRVGVLFFFAISGYVITGTLLREYAETGAVSMRAFYVRRACRIIPPLLLFLAAVGTAGALGLAGVSVRDLAAAALFTCNISLAHCADIVGHTWSLAFEEQFYLLVPGLLLWAFARRRPHAAIALAMVFFAIPFAWPLEWIGRVGFVQTYVLLAGGCAYAAWEERVGIPPAAAYLALAAVPVLAVAGAESRIVQALLLPAAILAAVFFVRRPLEFAPLAYLGRISYSVYLWQQLAAFAGPGLSWYWEVAAEIGAVAIAALSYATLEKYFIALGRRYRPRTTAIPITDTYRAAR